MGNLIAIFDFMLRRADSTWRVKSWRRQALMYSQRKRPDLWQTGWKAKACTSFALYLKVFKNHLHYLRHVRVLSIKPCLHTQLPEHNRSLIKKITQTAVINIVFQRIFFIWLDVSYASQHTFSKVTVTIFENYIYIYIMNNRGLEPRLRKLICSSTLLCVEIMRSNS